MLPLEHVLLIDDDPDFAALVQQGLPRLFAPQPCEVVVASTLALARHSLTSAPCDVILLDLRLPGEQGLDGLPALVQAMGQSALLPVVVLSGYLETDLTTQALRQGVQECVPKDSPQLLRALYEAMQRAALRVAYIGERLRQLRESGTTSA